MPTIKTVFGHEVEVDEDEAAALRRQGLVAREEPAPGDTAGYGLDAPGVSSSFAAADFAVAEAEAAAGAGGSGDEAGTETTEDTE